MRKMLAVLHYEYKMQFRHLATWGILLAATAISLMDNFPSAGNLARLEFLRDPAYFVYRIMSLDSLILLFGLMFLLAGRFPLDTKTGMKPLLMASPLQKWQYVLGKLLGGFLYVFSMLCIFLALNTAIYAAAAPFEISPLECAVPLGKAILVSAIPAGLFVSFVSVALPGMADIRLFYILAAALFGFNATYVGSAEAMPFYLITSGDLVRLIWVHPRWPFIDMGSVIANACFLVGSGIACGSLLFLKHKFWRAE
ncbi:MAG TPA: hypothetical protein IAA84_07505 [Candidatus Alectryocaccomicrobium excrementavium]|uniref:Uncharacterized protein n=1 Tax=Candidatus Alectryocaccomicrobium excrementavium TaxID=2840668 RepID=A0A9D1G1P1_9FIRM|nr:hypothetical protein [Candidatus Alectryocaccomicrobium excrementavium]